VAARIPTPRFEAYAATWGSHVYFIGGITGHFADIATAEPSRRVDVYDAATDTWSAGPDLPIDAPKHHLSVATMGDGIYVVGGLDGILGQHENEPFVPIARAYALRVPIDGVLTKWVALAPPPLARGAATAEAIDGKIYVTGGATTEGLPAFDQLDVYDADANTWTTSAPMPSPREHLASCALDGKFVVVGGWLEDVVSNAAESFDPKTSQWTKLPSLPTARGGLAAIAQNGECHVIGGEDWARPFPGTFHAHEIYDPIAKAWRTGLDMPTARHGFGLALLGDAMYAVGGGPSQGNSYTDVVEVLVP
jgi:N-acetylneuraminic acid mutarotase